MVPRILYLHPKTYKRLIRLRKQAERDGAYRVAKRKRPGSLRLGYGHLDLSHDRLGHRGGIRHSVSSGPCAQVAPSFRLLRTATSSRAGASQRGSAKSLAAVHLSQP
jgi:hypothetical protein